MIRCTFVNNQVLSIYKNLPSIKFPLDPSTVLSLFPNCRFMSYAAFGKITNISIEEVCILCESRFGCTHYEMKNNRYLVLCNQSTKNNNNLGRQRWTFAHEIGHIVCGHIENSAKEKICDSFCSTLSERENETEADYFAMNLLAPLPLIRHLNIRSVTELQDVFGLSTEASINTFKKFLKWNGNHYKTAWENDLIRTYLSKQ